MNWRELSYFYCITVLLKKKIMKGTKKYLHNDVLDSYSFIENYITKYNTYPPLKQYCRKFNINPKYYYEKGWTLPAIIDELKLLQAKSAIQECQVELQELLLDDHSLEEYLQPLNKLNSNLLKTSNTKTFKFSNYKKYIKLYYKKLANRKLKFGFQKLDQITGGIGQKDFILVYANTTQGKSTFSRQLAYNMASAGKKVLYITLEEPGLESILKISALAANINSKNLLNKKLYPNEMKKLKHNIKQLSGDIIVIDQLESRSIAEIHQLTQDHQPDIIFLDQLSHFLPKGDMDWKVVNAVCKQLQAFVQNAGIPLVLMHQAALHQKKVRAAWGTGPEQDADLALFLQDDQTDETGVVFKQVDITKNRNGERGISIRYLWDLKNGIIREQAIFNPNAIKQGTVIF